MGWTDEAYRDHANVFGKGADAMHITGDLSLADFATAREERRRGLPEARRLPAHARTRARSSSPWARSPTPWSRRPAPPATSRCGCRAGAPTSTSRLPDRLPQPVDPGRPRQRAVALARRQERAVVPDRPDPGDPTLCGRYFINADKGNDYGTKAAFPSWLYPGEGNRFVPGNDPGHLGGDTWAADAAIDDDGRTRTGRACSSPWAASTRPPTCGARRTTRAAGLHHARRADPHAVRGRERRRPARQDPRRRRSRSTPTRAARPWSC